MSYPGLFVVGIFLVVWLCLGRILKSRPSDYAAIETFAASKGTKVISIKRNDNHWRYWLRGKLLLSNISRIFIVTVEASDGARREFHLAFDPLGSSGGLRVLEER